MFVWTNIKALFTVKGFLNSWGLNTKSDNIFTAVLQQ